MTLLPNSGLQQTGRSLTLASRSWNLVRWADSIVLLYRPVGVETARRYPVQIAGGSSDRELWVPAEELADFNRHIVGIISVVEAFTGERFVGQLDPKTRFAADADSLPLGRRS